MRIIEIKDDTLIETKKEDFTLEKGDKIKIQEEKIPDLYAYLYNEYPKAGDLVSSIGREVDWDIWGARGFCLALLEDVNDHTMMAKIQKTFES